MTRRSVAEKLGGEAFDGCRDGRCATAFLEGLRHGELAAEPADRARLELLYGAGVERVDAALGVLFDRLEEAGMMDDLMIVLTSDHGEALLEEPRALLHGTFRNSVLEVPLLVKWPGGRQAGSVDRRVSSSLDVAPTILEASGLDRSGLPGANLADRRGERPAFSWDRWVSVVSGDLQLVARDALEKPPLLYDLSMAGDRQAEVSAERPDELERLVRLVEDRVRFGAELRSELRLERAPEASLSDEERRRLRALGYLGDAAPPAGGTP